MVPPLTGRDARRFFRPPMSNYLLLVGAVFCLGGAFGIQIPLFANFIHERFGIETHQYGYMEALREVPGFLTAFVGALVMIVPAVRLGMLSLLVMGIGMAAYAWATPLAELLGGSGVLALILISVFWSLGFHTWAPLQNTLALQFAPTAEKGRWLGWLRTASGIGNLSLMGLALLLIGRLEYEGMFLFAGGLLLLGAIAIGAAKPARSAHAVPLPERRLLLRRRYGVYYLLTFLSGARKQIFLMFAVWQLVKEHGVARETILTLMIVNQVANLLLSPTVGKLVDRFGERLTLSVSYVLLTLVFTGYALVPSVGARYLSEAAILWTLYILYVVDNLLFVGAIALTTYVNKIAPPEEIRPTLTMGVTMNHIPSVLVPLIGGWMWSELGPVPVFLGGALFAMMSLTATQWVRPEQQRYPLPPEAQPAD